MGSSIYSLLSSLPHLAVDLVALVMAIARWTKHPTVSMLVTVSVLISFLVRGLYIVGPRLLSSELGGTSMQLFFVGASFVSALAGALMVAAVFSERRDGTEPPVQRW